MMSQKTRGAALTIFAMLFALIALSNFSKPFRHRADIGFVFLGTRLTGVPNLIAAPLFGTILAVYAYGIWTMRKFALPIGYFYAAYVILNLLLFNVRTGVVGSAHPSIAFMLAYVVIAIGVSSGSALLLNRRKADLG